MRSVKIWSFATIAPPFSSTDNPANRPGLLAHWFSMSPVFPSGSVCPLPSCQIASNTDRATCSIFSLDKSLPFANRSTCLCVRGLPSLRMSKTSNRNFKNSPISGMCGFEPECFMVLNARIPPKGCGLLLLSLISRRSWPLLLAHGQENCLLLPYPHCSGRLPIEFVTPQPGSSSIHPLLHFSCLFLWFSQALLPCCQYSC